MELHSTEQSGFIILEPVGRLNIESAERFRQGYQQALDAGQARFVVDLGQTEYVDSSGLGALIGLLKRANANGGAVRVCNVPPSILNIFDLTRLSTIFDIRPTRADALTDVTLD